MARTLNTNLISNKIPYEIYESSKQGAIAVAQMIATLIKEKQRVGENCVLGLATGSTPEPMYAELIRMHKEEGLSFKNVITFNLDEYYPMKPESSQSYHYFMEKQLFAHVDIKEENVHVPDGTIQENDIKEYGASYDKQIADAGGIDIQILGIGNNGHIGFNEPGASRYSGTRLITLDENTREANARNFSHLEEVPYRAITMGIGSILKSKKIMLLAWGDKKADAVQKSILEEATESVPASLLQAHNNCVFIIDTAASRLL